MANKKSVELDQELVSQLPDNVISQLRELGANEDDIFQDDKGTKAKYKEYKSSEVHPRIVTLGKILRAIEGQTTRDAMWALDYALKLIKVRVQSVRYYPDSQKAYRERKKTKLARTTE